jgi:hypothetical protein
MVGMMKCERGPKRDLVKQWGIAALARGMSWDEVTATMSRLRRKTLEEVREFVRSK